MYTKWIEWDAYLLRCNERENVWEWVGCNHVEKWQLSYMSCLIIIIYITVGGWGLWGSLERGKRDEKKNNRHNLYPIEVDLE